MVRIKKLESQKRDGLRFVESNGKVWDIRKHSFNIRYDRELNRHIVVIKNVRNDKIGSGNYDENGWAISVKWIPFYITEDETMLLTNYKRLYKTYKRLGCEGDSSLYQ